MLDLIKKNLIARYCSLVSVAQQPAVREAEAQ